MLIDTHSHLFVEEFTEDLPLVMERAQKAGVSYIFMPNIDSTTIDAMLSVCRDYPGFCYPMIGLHPTSVNESYEQELAIVHKYLSTSREFVAIGEIGLDLYWDKTFLKEQILVFEKQIEWALEYGLPIVIHSREAFEYIYKVMEPYKNTSLTGIFHSFTGTSEEAAKLLEFDLCRYQWSCNFQEIDFAGGIDDCSFRAHCARNRFSLFGSRAEPGKEK